MAQVKKFTDFFNELPVNPDPNESGSVVLLLSEAGELETAIIENLEMTTILPEDAIIDGGNF